MIKDLEIEFIKAEDIKALADLASGIWHEYWQQILVPEQIDYMVEIFQSENAMQAQITNENYVYYIIRCNDVNAGYFGLSDRDGYMFLSKLYISRDYRHRGIGTTAFEKIKEPPAEKIYDLR